MKNNILTIVLAFAMTLPLSGLATANEYHELIISRNNVPVWLSDGLTASDIECHVNHGTSVDIIERIGRLGYLVTITDGPNAGCTGFVSSEDLERAKRTFQTVFNTGRWGNEIPVFRNRVSYFNARTSMDRNGHYREQSGHVACKVKAGTDVRFNPYKDWGVGTVKAGNCKGWIDREVIR